MASGNVVAVARLSPEEMEAARRAVRQKNASEQERREHIRESTRPLASKARATIEEFVRMGQIERYPLDEADLADEASVPSGVRTPRLWLESEIVRAYARVGAHATEPSTLAQWLLTSHDDTHKVDLEHLPKHAATPARVLAHLVSLGLDLIPRLAVTIARRASLLLMNADLGGDDGKEDHAGDPYRRGAEATRDAPRPAPGSEEPRGESPQGRVGDGDDEPRDGDPSGRAGEELGALRQGGESSPDRPQQVAGHDAQQSADERHQRRLAALLGARDEQIAKERARDEAFRARAEAREALRALLEARFYQLVEEDGVREEARAARREEPEPAPELTEPVPEEPPPYRLHPKYFPQMVIDLTGPRMEVSYRGDPARVIAEPQHAQARAPTGPRVVGYVEVREDMVFCMGKDYVTLPVGEVVELLQPSERDRKDLERFSKQRHPHTVIRWRGLSRCVPSRCVTRSAESAWNAQEKGSLRDA